MQNRKSRYTTMSYYLSGELCKTSQENIQKSVKARKEELGTFGEMFKIISTFSCFTSLNQLQTVA